MSEFLGVDFGRGGLSRVSDTCLKGSKSLSVLKHEDEVPKISHCCFPGDVFSLLPEETG